MKFVVAFRELPDWMFEEIFSAGAPVLICWFCCYSQACASISLSRCSHWGWSWCWRILSGIWTVFFAVRRTPIAFRVGNPFRFIKRCFNHKKPFRQQNSPAKEPVATTPVKCFPHSATPIEVQFHVPSQFSQVLSNARLGFWSLSPTVEDPAWGASNVLGLGLGLELKHGWKKQDLDAVPWRHFNL